MFEVKVIPEQKKELLEVIKMDKPKTLPINNNNNVLTWDGYVSGIGLLDRYQNVVRKIFFSVPRCVLDGDVLNVSINIDRL